MEESSIQLMKIVFDTTVDGPGWRNSIYCAGCSHACPGCHNPETWSFKAGYSATISEIINQLKTSEGDITFSGGDPMYQAEAFAELASRIRLELNRKIWCFTGFRFEQVVSDVKMSKLLPYLEVLVDGPFVESLKDDKLMFRGSSNQRLVDVQKSLAAGMVVEFPWNPYPEFD